MGCILPGSRAEPPAVLPAGPGHPVPGSFWVGASPDPARRSDTVPARAPGSGSARTAAAGVLPPRLGAAATAPNRHRAHAARLRIPSSRRANLHRARLPARKAIAPTRNKKKNSPSARVVGSSRKRPSPQFTRPPTTRKKRRIFRSSRGDFSLLYRINLS